MLMEEQSVRNPKPKEEGLLTREERVKDVKLSREVTMLKVKQSVQNPDRKKQGMWSPVLMVKGTSPEGWVHASRAQSLWALAWRQL